MQRCKSLVCLSLTLLLGGAAAAEPELHQSEASITPAAHASPAVSSHKRAPLASRSGRLSPRMLPQAVPSGRRIQCGATAYCLRGYTASGTYVCPGTVAVDPRVIPLGTRLYVSGYGYAVARDTGGAIVGNKIDVWFPSLGQCYQWGYRSVTVTILDEPRRRRR